MYHSSFICETLNLFTHKESHKSSSLAHFIFIIRHVPGGETRYTVSPAGAMLVLRCLSGLGQRVSGKKKDYPFRIIFSLSFLRKRRVSLPFSSIVLLHSRPLGLLALALLARFRPYRARKPAVRDPVMGLRQKKNYPSRLIFFLSFYGSDGTRTRDLRLDRPAR